MEKLTLEQICNHIPYGVKGILTSDRREDFYSEDWAINESFFYKNSIWELCGYAPGDLNIYLGDGIFDGFLWRKETTYVNFQYGVKPILRKCDLTKPIMVNGKKEIPIVELAKRFHTLSEATISHYDNIIDAGSYGIQVSCYLDKDRYGYYSVFADTDLVHHNESRVVKWLYAHLFDVDNLIEKGLAVDADTLQINPYDKP